MLSVISAPAAECGTLNACRTTEVGIVIVASARAEQKCRLPQAVAVNQVRSVRSTPSSGMQYVHRRLQRSDSEMRK